MRAIIDADRAALVLGRLLDLYERGEYPYNLPGAVLPQDPNPIPSSSCYCEPIYGWVFN